MTTENLEVIRTAAREIMGARLLELEVRQAAALLHAGRVDEAHELIHECAQRLIRLEAERGCETPSTRPQ